jgi:hypothetical protein
VVVWARDVSVLNKPLIYSVSSPHSIGAITTTTAVRDGTKPFWHTRISAPFYSLAGSGVTIEERYLSPPA